MSDLWHKAGKLWRKTSKAASAAAQEAREEYRRKRAPEAGMLEIAAHLQRDFQQAGEVLKLSSPLSSEVLSEISTHWLAGAVRDFFYGTDRYSDFSVGKKKDSLAWFDRDEEGFRRFDLDKNVALALKRGSVPGQLECVITHPLPFSLLIHSQWWGMPIDQSAKTEADVALDQALLAARGGAEGEFWHSLQLVFAPISRVPKDVKDTIETRAGLRARRLWLLLADS